MQLHSITDLVNVVAQALEQRDLDVLCKAEYTVSDWLITDEEKEAYIGLIDQASQTISDLHMFEEV